MFRFFRRHPPRNGLPIPVVIAAAKDGLAPDDRLALQLGRCQVQYDLAVQEFAGLRPRRRREYDFNVLRDELQRLHVEAVNAWLASPAASATP